MRVWTGGRVVLCGCGGLGAELSFSRGPVCSFASVRAHVQSNVICVFL